MEMNIYTAIPVGIAIGSLLVILIYRIKLW